MPLASTLYVGTDISEKMNRTRFYDEGGTEVGVRVESINDLPGAQDLAREALSTQNRPLTFHPSSFLLDRRSRCALHFFERDCFYLPSAQALSLFVSGQRPRLV
jgi:hypothetical protein